MYITEDTYHLTYVSFFQMKDSQIPSTPFKGSCAPGDHCPSWQYGCHIAKPLTCSFQTQTEPVIMSPMRYFINAAINTDDIVVPLNIHHDHGYAKLSSQSCMPSSTDHGSLVNVDDTSECPSLTVSIFRSFCLQQSEGKF